MGPVYGFEELYALQSASIQLLLLKTTALLALATFKRIALPVNATCLEFGPNNAKVVLKPRHGYVP